MGTGGFTLLEVLVSLVVLGAIVAGLAGGVRFGTAAWNAGERTLAAGGDLDAADRALRRLVAGMDPVGDIDTPPLLGSRSSLVFAADLPGAVAAPDGRRAAMRLAVTGGRLVLAWTPAPHATVLIPAAPTVTEVLPGVAALEVAYYGNPNGTPNGGTPNGSTPPQAAGWQESWSAPHLPALVRLRLVFPPGDPRHWADIVEAPRRIVPP